MLAFAALLSIANSPRPLGDGTRLGDDVCDSTETPILRFGPNTPLIDSRTWRKRSANNADLAFRGETVIRGRHAACIALYKVGFILMRNGSVFKRNNDVLQRRTLDYSPFSSRAAQTGPSLGGRRPTSVAGLSSEEAATRLIGVWPTRKGSAIALFEADANAKPRILGTSGKRLRGITYFPSPDAPLGGVNVIEEIGPEQIRIIAGILQDTSVSR